MSPDNSRTSAISFSRDKLARSMARLDGLARKAVEVIGQLKRERTELTTRVAQLEELLAQERTNAEQRDKLFQSDRSEREQRQAELSALKKRAHDSEILANEQQDTIAALERQVMESARIASEFETRARSTEERSIDRDEVERATTEIRNERDMLREQVVQLERETARWVVTLDKEAARKVERALEIILKRVEKLESSIEAKKAAPPEATTEKVATTARTPDVRRLTVQS